MKTKILLTMILFGLFSHLGYSQTILIDFGAASTTTPGNWNNITAATANTTASLINNLGVSTGYTLTITSAFGNPGNTGTASPTVPASTIFPITATQDFFFCTVTAVFTLTNLDVNKIYTFDVIASRVGISPVDNREGKYTAAGLTSGDASLDATNNTGNYVTISNIKPDATGKITFTVLKGANNTNVSNYFYLNAMRITEIDVTASTDYFRSTLSGNWSSAATWQSSHDNSNWLTATAAPTSSATAVTIQNGHTVAVDVNSNIASLALNSGSVLTVNPGKQFTVSSTLVNNGTLNLNSDGTNGTGTIITPATISGTGAVNVQQYLTAGRNWYISSPVTAATSAVITTDGNSFWSYDELNTGSVLWNPITATDVALNAMQGYVANKLADGVITFTGTLLNNGNKSIVLNRTENGKASRGFNLVGNPYPSYLDWVQASSNSSNLGTTMWYRTKSPGYVFATYNSAGGANTNGATQFIPPMQAFWVYVKPAGDLSTTTGTLAVTNNMRSHESGTNRLKVQSTKNESQQLLRLQVSDGTYTDEAVVYFDPNALNEFDTYDSPKRANGNLVPDIYTVTDNQSLAINGFNKLITNEQVTLGLKTGNSNLYTIKATEIKNFDSTTRIVLKDNFLNVEFDLTDGATYDLSPEVSLADTSRFKIIFKSQSVISEFQSVNDLNNVQVYQNANHQITININDYSGIEYSVIVCNSLGLMLENKRLSNSTNVLSQSFPAGVYFVTVYSKGKSAVRKIIIH